MPSCVSFRGNDSYDVTKFEGAVKEIRKLIHTAQNPQATAPTQSSPLDRIQQLAALHQARAVTDEEYNSKKQGYWRVSRLPL